MHLDFTSIVYEYNGSTKAMRQVVDAIANIEVISSKTKEYLKKKMLNISKVKIQWA